MKKSVSGIVGREIVGRPSSCNAQRAFASHLLRILRLAAALLGLALTSRSPPPAAPRTPTSTETTSRRPKVAATGEALSSVSRRSSSATGYKNGSAFGITVVHVDGKAGEEHSADAYVMAQAAARDGIRRIVSGFRAEAEQQYLYGCYTHCNCNGCDLAARPGYSTTRHQLHS